MNRSKDDRRYRPRSRGSRVLLPAVLVLALMMACSLFSGTGRNLEATMAAVGVQQTMLAQTAAALAQAQSTPAALQTLPVGPATATPVVTVTLPASQTLTTPNPGEIGEVDERLLKSAKILLFEDMSASRYIRYVKTALDEADYFYQDVGSATGWFKTQLLSSEDWDLVIAAAEARRDFGGEYFDLILQRVDQGAGAVVEYWDFDNAPHGRAKPFLDRCGLEIENDWYEPEMRVFFWLVPEHPVFNQPNEMSGQLGNAEHLWRGDVGDILKVRTISGSSVNQALLLAGTNAGWKNDHGVLATCVDGRVIVQTFASHEYRYRDMIDLWQNYVYQALKNHFIHTQASVPTPVVTARPTSEATPLPNSPGLTPGPAYDLETTCGGVFTARLLDAPRYQKDLFEHHAEGTFLILHLQMVNQTEFPIQIWDADYSVEGKLADGRSVTYPLHRASTGYLYIDRPGNLVQDLIQPGDLWSTHLSFDIDPRGSDWVLVVKPGSEFNEQVCDLRIGLTK